MLGLWSAYLGGFLKAFGCSPLASGDPFSSSSEGVICVVFVARVSLSVALKAPLRRGHHGDIL